MGNDARGLTAATRVRLRRGLSAHTGGRQPSGRATARSADVAAAWSCGGRPALAGRRLRSATATLARGSPAWPGRRASRAAGLAVGVLTRCLPRSPARLSGPERRAGRVIDASRRGHSSSPESEWVDSACRRLQPRSGRVLAGSPKLSVCRQTVAAHLRHVGGAESRNNDGTGHGPAIIFSAHQPCCPGQAGQAG